MRDPPMELIRRRRRRPEDGAIATRKMVAGRSPFLLCRRYYLLLAGPVENSGRWELDWMFLSLRGIQNIRPQPRRPRGGVPSSAAVALDQDRFIHRTVPLPPEHFGRRSIPHLPITPTTMKYMGHSACGGRRTDRRVSNMLGEYFDITAFHHQAA